MISSPISSTQPVMQRVAPETDDSASATHVYHTLANLLDMSASQILAFYRNSQLIDFTTTLGKVKHGTREMADHIEILAHYLASYPSEGFHRRLNVDSIERLFRQMHDHVMQHPVWVHPFFARITDGDIAIDQLTVFARHYFNQVKNTRQCVALALGRFHTLIDRPDGQLNNVLAELTQVVLAGLLSDEYGTAAAKSHYAVAANGAFPAAPAVDIGQLFSPITHPALFRRFLHAFGVTASGYDVPLLHGVADNVLVQRILSNDPAYSELEALASVGLGMEWGVPAFFSMVIAGILKVARREGLVLQPEAMEIWTSHVKQDVEHAIAVMIATCFYVCDGSDARRIEGATNVLMAFRYNMMSDIYQEVFGAPCPRIADIALDPRYFLHDRRIEPLLATARSRVSPASIRDYDGYLVSPSRVPFGKSP
jgi:hypothetical protein